MIIYCIEDINDLKYVGSTKQKLYERLNGHKWDEQRGKKCSSRKLNLYNSIIYQLEECVKDQRKERERYWINKIDCVNKKKLNGRDKEKQKEYMKEYMKGRKLLKLSDQKINL